MKACFSQVPALIWLALLVVAASPHSVAQDLSTEPFPPVRQWQAAIDHRDANALVSLYSQAPPASVRAPSGSLSAGDEVAFWTGLKASSLDLDIQQSTSPQPGLRQLVLEVEVRPGKGEKKPVVYISAMQVWQKQGEVWRIVASERTDAAKLQQPTSTTASIYPEGADAHLEIKEALERAGKAHKRVIVVFGANWCYDCHVLDKAFHRPDLEPLLKKNYEIVHIDVGRGEKNQDLMNQYQVPMKRGIPGLAVLDSNGAVVYSQKNGEFEKARSLAPQDLMDFLNKWKS